MSRSRKVQNCVSKLIREVTRAEERITIFSESGHDYDIGFFVCGKLCGYVPQDLVDDLFEALQECIDKMGTEQGPIVGQSASSEPQE